MSTQLPANNPSDSPQLPLNPETRAAYEDLYEKMQDAIDSTMDAATIEALNPCIDQVDDVLTKDDSYKLAANTTQLANLTKQIRETNRDLEKLRDQISSVASHLALAGNIIAGIDKVLSLVPKL